MTLRRRHLLVIHSIAIAALSLLASFVLRFDFRLSSFELGHFYSGLWIFVTAKALVFYVSGQHRRLGTLVGIGDLLRIAAANMVGSIVAFAATYSLIGPAFPRSVYVIDGMICFMLTAGSLFSPRLYRELAAFGTSRSPNQRKLLIYGAGFAGLTLAKEIRSNCKLNTCVIGFMDDDPAKVGASLAGIPVLTTGAEAAQLMARQRRKGVPISEIVIAMPSATGSQMRTVIANCRAAGVPFKTVPGLGELLEGKVLNQQVRNVSVNDLLGREPVRVAEDAIGEHVAGKSVMVTGGCGSIGSELCRQLARFNPRRLLIFDQAESEMFMLALELRERFPSLDLVTEIGDITCYQRVTEAMARNEIEAVFHAAAYKHVPLMEANIIEAAKNNVLGTYNVVRAAYAHGVGRFLMISSDKAVNPTSIMGVTKRIGELIVSGMRVDGHRRQGTLMSVRFGNVLASNGSVVEIFKRQISTGGPVTVTHPDMRRYFMSIPEAVQLVLQAFSMATGGEVFVLDMGEPVRITELARNMIRLAGFTPDEDIQIRYTGVRPGEKLFEELKVDTEDMLPTYHEKIKIFHSLPPMPGQITAWIKKLQFFIKAGDAQQVKEHLLSLVPEYIGLRESEEPGQSARVQAAVKKARAGVT